MLLLLSSFFILSCNPFKPTPDPEPEPGSRNYVWEIDTLHMPINYISAVWGASPNELWAVGAGGTDYDRLMHFDGESWSPYTKEAIYCAGRTLFGFDSNDVWMGGGVGYPVRGGGLWHYDGQIWKQEYLYLPDDRFYSVSIRNVWGESSNEIYACGTISYYDGVTECWRGFVLQYDGDNWIELAKANFNTQFVGVCKDDNGIFVQSYGIN